MANRKTKPGADDPNRIITLADVHKLMNDQDTAFQMAAEVPTSRRAYVAKNMMDLPEVYRDQLKSNDPETWPEDEQVIRTGFRADLNKLGIRAPNLGGESADGVAPMQAMTMGPLTAQQKLKIGLQMSRPAQSKR